MSGDDQARVASACPKTSFAVAISLVPMLVVPVSSNVKVLVFTLVALNIAIGVLNIFR
jgi:hypothetical protein